MSKMTKIKLLGLHAGGGPETRLPIGVALCSSLKPYHILHIVWTVRHYIHVSKTGRWDSVALNLRSVFRQIP